MAANIQNMLNFCEYFIILKLMYMYCSSKSCWYFWQYVSVRIGTKKYNLFFSNLKKFEKFSDNYISAIKCYCFYDFMKLFKQNLHWRILLQHNSFFWFIFFQQNFIKLIKICLYLFFILTFQSHFFEYVSLGNKILFLFI